MMTDFVIAQLEWKISYQKVFFNREKKKKTNEEAKKTK